MDLLELETYVIDKIISEFSTDLTDEYPDLRFTTSDREPIDPTFPCVYVHLARGNEIGADLQGDSINGADVIFEIEVSDNDSQERVQVIQKEVVRIMNLMRFRVTQFPVFQNGTSIYRGIGRYRRSIGANNTTL